MNDDKIRNVINNTDIEVIDLLNNINPEAKEQFMESNDILVPDNKYDLEMIEPIKDNIRQIEETVEDIKKLVEDYNNQRLYLYLLNNNLLRNQLVYVDSMWRETGNDDEKKALEKKHQSINSQLFGDPDYDIFLGILNDVLDSIEEADLEEEEKDLYNDLNKMIGPIEKPKQGLYRPSEETFYLFSEYAKNFLHPILQHIPNNKTSYTIREACDIANKILDEEFGMADTWTAIVEPGGSTACVIPLQNLIRFPEKRSLGDYSEEDLRKILAHEIGTHVFRSIVYMDCPYQVFKTGLPGYVSFEEGLACAMEQAIEGRYKDCGLVHYISIGLAVFLKKNFREIYEIQWRLQKLTDHLPKGKCYDSVNRTFRGTGKLTNHKDLAYYTGYMKLWKFVEKHLDDPDLFDILFLSGKTDMTMKEHEELLYEMKVGIALS